MCWEWIWKWDSSELVWTDGIDLVSRRASFSAVALNQTQVLLCIPTALSSCATQWLFPWFESWVGNGWGLLFCQSLAVWSQFWTRSVKNNCPRLRLGKFISAWNRFMYSQCMGVLCTKVVMALPSKLLWDYFRLSLDIIIKCRKSNNLPHSSNKLNKHVQQIETVFGDYKIVSS